MTRLSRILALAVGLSIAALLAPTSIQPTEAASVYLCAPPQPGTAPGPRRVTNPGSSGGSYQLNANGCARISAANSDAAYFQSQGFYQPGGVFALAQNALSGSSTVSPWQFQLPPGAYIQNIIVQNTTANAVTGGVKVGTTSGGTEVVTALTCGANCLTFVADADLTLRVFSATASQTLFMDAVTSHNNASLNITVLYSLY